MRPLQFVYYILDMSLLANYPFFFDSPEYVALSQMPIVDALYLVHPLAHPISMVMWRLAYLIFGSSVAALSLTSLIFWVMGVIFAAQCVSRDRRWVVYIVCILLPLPWLVMTNVLVDAVSMSLFVMGVASIWKQRRWNRIILSTIFFGLAMFNYLGMIAWIAIPIFTIWSDKKLILKEKIIRAIVIASSALIAIGALWIMGLLTNTVGIGLSSVPIAIYHAGVAFVANYTWVSIAVVFGFGVYWFIKKEWPHLLIMMGVGVIYCVSLVPWHSGPYGRLGVFLIFPLAYLYSMLPKWLSVLAIVLIVPSWFKIVSAYQATPLPILQQNLVETSDCSEKQLILSEIQRPQLSTIYPSAWYVGPANWQEIVNNIADSKEEICISKQALDYPYRQYEGQLPYPLSGRIGSIGFLQEALTDTKIIVIKEDPTHTELTIYGVSR